MLAGMPAAGPPEAAPPAHGPLPHGPLVRRLRPDLLDDQTVAAWDDIFRRVHAVETGASAPPPAAHLPAIRRRLAAPEPARWIGWLGDRPAGVAEVGGTPHDSAYTRVYVDPAYRGQGLGRALLGEVVATLGKVPVLAATVLVGTPGERFAFGFGAEVGDELVIQSLDLRSADPAALGAVLDGAPPGYELVHWRTAAPAALVDSYAVLKRAIADAPNAHGPSVPPYDAARVRTDERGRALAGAELWVSAAVESATARVVAFTEVGVGSSRTDANQEGTVVAADHRRRGLASLVKADMILRLRRDRPELRRVSTTTALANTGMRAVNARLGFQQLARRRLLRVPMSAVRRQVRAARDAAAHPR